MKILQNVVYLFLFLLLISSCNTNAQKQTAEAMLKDSVKQKEIFNAIYSDHTQMSQFMQGMMQNEHAIQMMAGNHQMMMDMMKKDTSMCKMMMGNMMDMMEKDSSMCKMMCKQMMNNGHMKGMMGGGMMKEEMMCPMHGKMNMGEMKKGEMKHHNH